MKRGFTLIELLVVVAIIGMLSSVVLAALGDARASARDTRRVQDLKQIQTALELYREENNNSYPVCSNEYIDDQTGCLASALVPRYMPSVPVDPLYGGNGSGEWGGDYQYSSGGATYYIRTALERTPLRQTHAYFGGQCANGFDSCTVTGETCVYLTSGCAVQWYHIGG